MATKALHQNFLGRLAYPAHRLQDGEPGPAWPVSFTWATSHERRDIFIARIIAIRENKEGDLVVSLESKEGLLADNVPVSGIKLAPEESVLIEANRIAIPPRMVPAGESNIRTVTATERSYELVDVEMGTLIKEYRAKQAQS